MKRKKHTLLCLLLAAAFVSGCAQKHKEGEPDVISSMKMNQDEILTVVANRNQIEDKEDFAKFLVKKCKDNSFSSLFLHHFQYIKIQNTVNYSCYPTWNMLSYPYHQLSSDE